MQRPPKIAIGPPHPDPIVETSSLSAVQPPEPKYDLTIKDELESSKVLSCLQIETLVYACQVVFTTQLIIFLTCKLHHFHFHFIFLNRDTFNTFRVAQGLDFSLVMELVSAKEEQLQG